MKKVIEGLVLGCLIVALIHIRTLPKEKFVEVIDAVMPAVVEIHVTGIKQGSTGTILGSGAYINDSGYLLTCAHLFNFFDKNLSVTVQSPTGDVVFGRIVNVGNTVDLAVVKVDYYKKTPFVYLADPRTLKVGQEVFAIGSPLGLSFSVSNGIISALYRDFDEKNYNVTQSNTAINPGNSGGPLFNLKGEIVGVNTFMLVSSPFEPPVHGLGFSVQCGEANKFIIDSFKLEKRRDLIKELRKAIKEIDNAR